jgi:hypothetical protein
MVTVPTERHCRKQKLLVTRMAALCNASSSAQFACREDKHVSYGFVEKQGRRGNMEDFTFAQVSVK